MLNCAELIVGGSIGDVVHPAVFEQRRGGSQSAGRAGMLIRIELLEQQADLLHQLEAVLVFFEGIDNLPGDVEGRVARHHVADEALAVLPSGIQFR